MVSRVQACRRFEAVAAVPQIGQFRTSREYLLTGIANAVPKTTRQRAGRQAETVVGVGPTGPANTTTRLPAGPAAHHAVPGLPPGEDAWRSETARRSMQLPTSPPSWRLRTSATGARGAS